MASIKERKDKSGTVISYEISVFKCRDENGKQIFHMSRFDDLCRRMNIRMGIITVPAAAAQSVCDRMIANGILAILNFAPAHLEAPKEILIQDENMATALALLSGHLKKKLKTAENKGNDD